MKITKEMGRACISEMDRIASGGRRYIDGVRGLYADDSLTQLGWCYDCEDEFLFTEDGCGRLNAHEIMTALAMCAAIAGVSHAR